MALGNILITAVPTPSGIVSSKFRDGDDSGASPPTDPQIGQPSVLNDDAVDIPLVTASTGGTAPLAYELSLSTTSGIAGFAVVDASADFSGDGVYSLTGLAASTQYWVRLATVDSAVPPRRSGLSGTFTFTTEAAVGGDVTAPTAPTNLQATSTVAGQASLTWTNGTDAVGIARTFILRGNSSGGVPTNAATVIDEVVGTGSSYTDVSAPAGQEVFYRVYHGDDAGNTSAWTDRFFVTIASASASSKKWYPGHGIKVKDDVGNSTAQTLSDQQGKFSKMSELPQFKYAECRVRWGRVNTVGSTYDWLPIDSNLAAASALGKKVAVLVEYKAFQNGTAFLCPSDLTATAVVTNSGYMMPMWLASTMDRYIAFWQAFAARYNGDSRIAFVSWSESAPSLASPFPAGYSRAAYAVQLKRLYAATSVAFPNTLVSAALNSLGSELPALLEEAYQQGLGVYNPDAHDTFVSRLFRGETVPTVGTGVRDYRGLMAYTAVASQPNLGGKDDMGTPAAIIDQAQLEDMTHLAWYATSELVTPNSWTEIKAAISADPLLYSTCPTNHSGGCDLT